MFLHPLSVHKLDSGPIRLATITHAFNYRVAVMRDGVSIRVGRSRKVEGRFLTNTDLSWGQQVAVMFQIISTMTLVKGIAGLRGVSPDVQLYSEPWGHVNHSDVNCACLSSDRMAAYVHDLALMPRERLPASEVEDASVHTWECGVRMCHAYCMGVGRPGSVPFVSDRPCVYGRLLLAIYVRWKGLLVSSDWPRPVIRGDWRVRLLDPVRGSVDVS